MVGDQRVSAHTFVQSKVFAAISGIDGVDLGVDALTVAEPLTGTFRPIVPKTPTSPIVTNLLLLPPWEQGIIKK